MNGIELFIVLVVAAFHFTVVPWSERTNQLVPDSQLYQEVQELLSSMEENEAPCYLHESVEYVEPSPRDDYYELGYPAKFSKFRELPNCTSLGIIRHGIFLRIPYLPILYSR